MALPFFYINDVDTAQGQLILNEETSKHIAQVLRMKEGEQLNLTDGKGALLTCVITDNHKKRCVVAIKSRKQFPEPSKKLTIAISLLKNANRFEWFLEKATEIGVSEIIPLVCERTEKEKLRFERMQGIVVSAMLQSQQTWLPVLQEPASFSEIIKQAVQQQKFIAHCDEGNKPSLHQYNHTPAHQIICIGPEGDFTPTEIGLALQYHFMPVSLGDTRLRTETAGVVAATLLKHPA